MIYLVDGHNVCFYLKNQSGNNQKNIEEYIQQLINLSNSLNNVIIVFDGLPVGFTPKQNVKVFFTNSRQGNDSADDFIIHLLNDLKNVTVITNDRHLRNRVKAKGEKILSVEHFIKMVRKKSLPRPRPFSSSELEDEKVKRAQGINSKELLEEMKKRKP